MFPVLIYSFTHDTILRFNPASLYGRWNPQHLPVMEGVTEHGRENPPFFRRIAWLACQTALDAAKIPMIFHFWWMLRSQSSNQSKPNWIHIHALPNWTSSRHSIQPLKGRSMWENPGFSWFFSADVDCCIWSLVHSASFLTPSKHAYRKWSEMVVWNIFWFSIILGISSSQLTYIFQKGGSTTNQSCSWVPSGKQPHNYGKSPCY